MNKPEYEKVPVTFSSIEDMAENGFELGEEGDTEGQLYSQFAKNNVFSSLTSKQRKVVRCMNDGLTRKEIARALLISEQAVNQIIPRIRKRLVERGISYGKFNRGGGSKKPRLSIPSTPATYDRQENFHSLA